MGRGDPQRLDRAGEIVAHFTFTFDELEARADQTRRDEWRFPARSLPISGQQVTHKASRNQITINLTKMFV